MVEPVARCLDITRLVSRLGQGPATGIDRVELAYLRQLTKSSIPLYLFVRTWAGYLLMPPRHGPEILARITGKAEWGSSDILSGLNRTAHPLKKRAEADLRRYCLARCRPRNLWRMLSKNVPQGTAYLNVGHSNLNQENLRCWRAVGSVSVLIHDTIPLDYPELQKPGTVERFENRLNATLDHAEQIFCISQHTRQSVQHWAKTWSKKPPSHVVAPIGVDVPPVRKDELPSNMPPIAPYFVSVGTIEPRKNHALLLSVWQEMVRDLRPHETPRLVIAGKRGWNNSEVFDQLDGSPLMGRQIFELSNLSDGALGALVHASNGLLFPTMAEGYGLPPLEALALDKPVICSDLPIFREILGDIPIYAPPGDMYSWKQSILHLAGKKTGQAGESWSKQGFKIPTWADHFNLVLKVT